MSISYVGGFLCLNTDDVLRAKQGLAPLPVNIPVNSGSDIPLSKTLSSYEQVLPEAVIYDIISESLIPGAAILSVREYDAGDLVDIRA